MAFNPQELTALAQGNSFTLWHYRTTEAQSAVLTAGYFDAAQSTLHAGDLIVLQTADGVSIVPVHAVLAPGSSLGSTLVLDSSNNTTGTLGVPVQGFSLDATASASLGGGSAVPDGVVVNDATGNPVVNDATGNTIVKD